MKSIGVWLGSLVSAAIASLCCLGPVLFAALGVGAGATGFLGGTARFAKALVPYRPLFILLTFGFLAMGAYQLFWKPAVCAPGEACSPEARRFRSRIVFLGLASIAIVLLLLPYLLEAVG